MAVPGRNPCHTPATAEQTIARKKIGDRVLFVVPDGINSGVIRPAIIVRVDSDRVNLQVFTDNTNDYQAAYPGASGIMWATSVTRDEETKAPGTYHSIAGAPQSLDTTST